MWGYIRDNKTLGLKYYADFNDVPVTDLLRQANSKTKNHLMDFSDSSWQYCPDTGRSTGAYIIFYQGGPIDHGTHVPVNTMEEAVCLVSLPFLSMHMADFPSKTIKGASFGTMSGSSLNNS